LIKQGDATHPVSASEQIHLLQSGWIKQLDHCGYARILIFEVPIYESDDLQSQPGLKRELEAAQAHLLRGQYTDVAIACRKALEALGRLLHDSLSIEAAKRAYKDDRSNMPLEQRTLFTRAALHSSLHLAAHADATSAAAIFSRRDAIWALTMTAAAIRHALDQTMPASVA
jgi:hypothetical protein